MYFAGLAFTLRNLLQDARGAVPIAKCRVEDVAKCRVDDVDAAHPAARAAVSAGVSCACAPTWFVWVVLGLAACALVVMIWMLLHDCIRESLQYNGWMGRLRDWWRARRRSRRCRR